jgi:hypothetical protein
MRDWTLIGCIWCSLKDPELFWLNPFEINQPQTYRGPNNYVGWMRDTLAKIPSRSLRSSFLIFMGFQTSLSTLTYVKGEIQKQVIQDIDDQYTNDVLASKCTQVVYLTPNLQLHSGNRTYFVSAFNQWLIFDTISYKRMHVAQIHVFHRHLAVNYLQHHENELHYT